MMQGLPRDVCACLSRVVIPRTVRGSSESQPLGMTASSSGMVLGASSSQSSGFTALGSLMRSSSTCKVGTGRTQMRERQRQSRSPNQ